MSLQCFQGFFVSFILNRAQRLRHASTCWHSFVYSVRADSRSLSTEHTTVGFREFENRGPVHQTPVMDAITLFGGDVLFTLSSVQVYPRLRNRSSDRFVRKAANDHGSSNRRWEAVLRLLGHSFFRRLFFFLIWKRFLCSLLGDNDRVVGKPAQNSVPLVVSKLVLYDCRHQLC